MDNNDSNIKSQQTGGLKLMTVFIAVLALHVVVIGGFTVYHLMSGGSTDADLTTTDKTHKGMKNMDGSAMADATLPDPSQSDKSIPASAPTPPAEVATIPTNPPTPAPDLTAPTVATTPVLTAPALTLTTPKPTTLTPPMEMANQGVQTPTGPISPELAPPAEPSPASVVVPTAPIAAGPVHMPPVAVAPAAPKIEHEHAQTYVVKITDSYKKIAHAHHITIAQLKEANHIKGDTLHTGQKLVIPSGKTAVAENAPASATTLDAAPTVRTQSEITPTSTAILTSAPSTMTTSASHSRLYTVMKGDTLIKIAHKFKTTPTAIMTENSITDPSKLTIGKKLKIPSKESRSAVNAVPSPAQPSQVQAKEQYEPTPASGQLANFVP